MRKKLLLLELLILIAVVFLYNERKAQVFVSDESKINIVMNNDIEESNDLIYDLSNGETTNIVKNILEKYTVVNKEDTYLCGKENTTLIKNTGKYNVISVDEENNFEYFRENNGECSLIGRVENVDFTSSVVETYANESIYTSFDSINDFEMSGLIRITNDDIIPFDTIDKRYTNPIAFKDGVLLIENNRNIRAFDKNDEIIFSQVNNNNDREIIAINAVDKALFVVVQKSDKIILEGYSLDRKNQIKERKPAISYDITKDFNFDGQDIITKSNEKYASFSNNDSAVIVAKDFSSLFLLEDIDTVIGLDLNTAILKMGELFYIVDLEAKLKEEIGEIKVLAFKTQGKDLFFSILDSKNEEKYIKYTIK